MADTVFQKRLFERGYGKPNSLWAGDWLVAEEDMSYIPPGSVIPRRLPLHPPRTEDDRNALRSSGVETHRIIRHGKLDRRDSRGWPLDFEEESSCIIASLFQPHHLPSSTCAPNPNKDADEDDDPGHVTYRRAFEWAVFPSVQTLTLQFEMGDAVSDPVRVVNETGVTVWDTLEQLHEA